MAGSRPVVYGDAERYVEIQRYNKPGELPLRLQTEAVEGCAVLLWDEGMDRLVHSLLVPGRCRSLRADHCCLCAALRRHALSRALVRLRTPG